MLSADALEAEELKGFVSACYSAGIEAVVEASDRGALERAEEAGAKIVCVRGVSSVDEAAELHTLVPHVCLPSPLSLALVWYVIDVSIYSVCESFIAL